MAKKPTKTTKKVVKKTVKKDTVKITNIANQDIVHNNGTIKVGKSGEVTPYEADLYRRKKLAK